MNEDTKKYCNNEQIIRIDIFSQFDDHLRRFVATREPKLQH